MRTTHITTKIRTRDKNGKRVEWAMNSVWTPRRLNADFPGTEVTACFGCVEQSFSQTPQGSAGRRAGRFDSQKRRRGTASPSSSEPLIKIPPEEGDDAGSQF